MTINQDFITIVVDRQQVEQSQNLTDPAFEEAVSVTRDMIEKDAIGGTLNKVAVDINDIPLDR